MSMQHNYKMEIISLVNISVFWHFRDKSQQEKLQILGSHTSPLCEIDLNVSGIKLVFVWWSYKNSDLNLMLSVSILLRRLW